MSKQSIAVTITMIVYSILPMEHEVPPCHISSDQKCFLCYLWCQSFGNCF